MAKPMSYRDLEVFQLAFRLAVETHKRTLSLPKFEMFEEGSQFRRSAKSVVHNIVEGFGRRKYRNDFLKFLTIAIAECDETQVTLDLLHKTGSLKNEVIFQELQSGYCLLAKKLNRFHSSVSQQHISEK